MPVTVAWLFDDRSRRLLLAEAMHAFAAYLRAKAALYNPDATGPAAFRALIDAHATLADRLQAARDSLFARRKHRMQLKRIDTLIALLDAFETVLSSDADIETLARRAPSRPDVAAKQLRRPDGGRGRAADIGPARAPRPSVAAQVTPKKFASWRMRSRRHTPHRADDPVIQAYISTADKLILADSYIGALASTLENATPPSDLAAHLNLDLFRQHTPRGLGLLANQFRWHSPALRYAIRLSLAMTAGLGLTLLFNRFDHANWVLLTIALIMRANYSVTRRRRWDRVTGTLIGCALAVTFINTMPAPVLLLFIVLAVGVSHAYGLVAYRITAVGASISSLLLLHFVAPLVHPQFFERIVDTLIGAGLSWAFSYLLPSWESEDLPRTVRGLLDADAGFADAALRRAPVKPGLPPGAQESRGCRGATIRRHPPPGGRTQRQPPGAGGAGRAVGSQLPAGLGSVFHAGAGEAQGAGPGRRECRRRYRQDPRTGGGDAEARRNIACRDGNAAARQPGRYARQRGDGGSGAAAQPISNIPRRKWRGWRADQ